MSLRPWIVSAEFRLCNVGHPVGTTTSEKPFILGVSFPFQMRKLVELGNNGLVTMDATFGTNSFGVRSTCIETVKCCTSL